MSYTTRLRTAAEGGREARRAEALRAQIEHVNRMRGSYAVNTNVSNLGVYYRALPANSGSAVPTRSPPVEPGTGIPPDPYADSWTPTGSPPGSPVTTPRTPGILSPQSLVMNLNPGAGLRVWPAWGRVFPEGARGVDGEILDLLPRRTGWFKCPFTRLWGPATTVVCDPPFECALCFDECQEQARCACGPHGGKGNEDKMCCACVGRLLRE